MAEEDESKFWSSETAGSIMGELIKAYGFRRSEDGWDWSLENIGQAFAEEPVWSTIDWLAVGVPVLKWGRAAKTVQTSGKLAGEMLRAGEFAKKSKLTRGRMRRALGSDNPGKVEQFWEAMKYEESLPRYGKTRRILGSDVNLKGYFSTLMGRRVDPTDLSRYAKNIDVHEWERMSRGYNDLLMREKRVFEAAVESRAGELIGQMNKLEDRELREVFRLMGTHQASSSYRKRLSALSPQAQDVAKRTMPFRNEMHNQLWKTHAISTATKKKWDKKYAPGLYEETFYGAEASLSTIGTRRGQKLAGQRLMGRTVERDLKELDTDTLRSLWANQRGTSMHSVPTNRGRLMKEIREFDRSKVGENRLDWEIISEKIDGLTPITDPRASLKEIANMASIVGMRRYADRLVKSPLSVRASSDMDLLNKVGVENYSDYVKIGSLVPGRDLESIIKGNATVRAIRRKIQSVEKEINRLARSDKSKFVRAPIPVADDLASAVTGKRRAERFTHVNVTDHSGIRRKGSELEKTRAQLYDQLSDAESRAMRSGFFQNLPSHMLDTYVPRYVADQIDTVMRMSDPRQNFLLRFVEAVNTTFKVGKTAYSMPTHGRNFISNHVFWLLSTGDINPSRHLATAFKELRASVKGGSALVNEARDIGLLGSTFSKEILEDLAHLYGGVGPKDDLLVEYARRIPGIGGLIKKAARTSRSLYGYEDDIWKLAAYAKMKEKMAKGGLKGKVLKERAFHEVVKYFPMYNDTSAFTQVLRRYVPFVSFTHESMRVWKNAMTWKPWLAVGIFNMADMTTQATAAWMGFNEDDLERAKAMLPDYTKGKKMLMLPLASEDTPFTFLDMSYHIPLADMGAEAEMMESAFFGLPAAVNPLAVFGITSNPIVSMAVAGTTGKDPFTQQEVEPRFIEQQLGVQVPESIGGIPTRPAAGVVEHFFRQVLPPMIPPGYHATNLLEKVRGQKNPATGDELEQESWARTIGTNLLGLRTYSPSESNAQTQFRADAERLGRRVRTAWKQFDWAMAQGNYQDAYVAENRALQARAELEFSKMQRAALLEDREWDPERWRQIALAKARKYVSEQMKKRMPGKRPTPLVSKQSRRAAREAAEAIGARMVDEVLGQRRMQEYLRERRSLAEGG